MGLLSESEFMAIVGDHVAEVPLSTPLPDGFWDYLDEIPEDDYAGLFCPNHRVNFVRLDQTLQRHLVFFETHSLNSFMVVVVDLEAGTVLGHHLLNTLNMKQHFERQERKGYQVITTVPGAPEQFRHDLWVTAEGYDERLYLGYNPHTFVGRIGVWSEALGYGTRIDKYEITSWSPGASAWVAGYLTGAEPHLADMYSETPFEAADDEDRVVRWRNALDEFRSTGSWIYPLNVHLTPFEPDAVLPDFVWNQVGDEIWTWNGLEWVLLGAVSGALWSDRPPTACDEAQEHDSGPVDRTHYVCALCGMTQETLPD